MKSTVITPAAYREFISRKETRFEYLGSVVGASLSAATRFDDEAITARLNGNHRVVCHIMTEAELVNETYKQHELGWCSIGIIQVDDDLSAVFMWRN